MKLNRKARNRSTKYNQLIVSIDIKANQWKRKDMSNAARIIECKCTEFISS